MLAGGDFNCRVGKMGSLQDMKSCAEKLTREQQKPYGVDQSCVVPIGPAVCVSKVIALQECRENKIYNSTFGDNEDSAKQCAHALTLLNGVKHEAFILQSRLFLWSPYKVYQVRKAK